MPEAQYAVKLKFCAVILALSLAGVWMGASSPLYAGEYAPPKTSLPNDKSTTSHEGTANVNRPLPVIFFFTPGCRMCVEATATVQQAERKYGRRIQVEWIDLSAPGTAHATRLFALLSQYNFTALTTPPLNVFVGSNHLAGGREIAEKLPAVLARELLREVKTPAPSISQSESTPNRYGFWYITAAALADGVNPCAFATMVLLVSMLAAAKKTRREIVLVGCAFTAAVYVTYFLIGLLGYGLLRQLAHFSTVADLVYLAAFGLAIIGGILSMYDAVIIWRGGKVDKVILQLPSFLKTRLRRQLSAGVRARNLFAGAWSAGVVVSVLESACTGQVYFPVIAGLLKEDKTRGVLLLAWYNLVFVLPLLTVFGATILGVSSKRLAQLGRRHLGTSKLLLAVVFWGMAWWLWEGLRGSIERIS